MKLITPEEVATLEWSEKFNVKLYSDVSKIPVNTNEMQEALQSLKSRFKNLMEKHGFESVSEPTVTVGRSDGKVVMALQATVKLSAE